MNGRRVPVTVAVVTLLAGAAVLLDAPAVLRLPLVVAFLLVCPGLAWVPRPRDGSAGDTVALAAAVSIAGAAVVGETMALTGTWRPLVAFAVLTGVTVAGVVVRLRAIHREDGEPGAPPGDRAAEAPIRGDGRRSTER